MIESKNLWEEAKYTAVKPINCLSKYKLAMPAQLNLFDDCLSCQSWKNIRSNKHREVVLFEFSVNAGSINVAVNQKIKVSLPVDPFYEEKWLVKFAFLCFINEISQEVNSGQESY